MTSWFQNILSIRHQAFIKFYIPYISEKGFELSHFSSKGIYSNVACTRSNIPPEGPVRYSEIWYKLICHMWWHRRESIIWKFRRVVNVSLGIFNLDLSTKFYWPQDMFHFFLRLLMSECKCFVRKLRLAWGLPLYSDISDILANEKATRSFSVRGIWQTMVLSPAI